MVPQEDMKTVLKKSKLKNAKDFLTKFTTEDPFLTATLACILSTFFPILLTILVQAIWQNQIRMIILVLQIIAAINFILIFPLLILRIWSYNRGIKTKAEIQAMNDFVKVKKYIEQQKYKQVNELTRAKIMFLQGQTQLILSFSDSHIIDIIKKNAQTLQQDFTKENIHETMENLFDVLGQTINRFNRIGEQYDQAIGKIEKICEGLDIEKGDLTVEVPINPKQSLQELNEKFKDIMSDVPAPTTPFEPEELDDSDGLSDSLSPDLSQTPAHETKLWDCRCGRSYKATVSRCSKCGKNKPT